MPVLQIRALPQSEGGQILIPKALKETCLAIAKAYGCDPGQVWATWQTLEPGHYVEGERSADLQPHETHPPIGELLCFEGKDSQQIETILMAASQTLSGALGSRDNIFLTYREAHSGRVVAGNGIVRKKV